MLQAGETLMRVLGHVRCAFSPGGWFVGCELRRIFFVKVVANSPLMPKVKAVARGLNELGVVGFVRKVVLFCFCLLNVQRVRYSSEYQLIRCLYIDVTGVGGDNI